MVDIMAKHRYLITLGGNLFGAGRGVPVFALFRSIGALEWYEFEVSLEEEGDDG
ncbi:hypothetical protein SS1G_06717 [Sclerotinia sclerotiorum 1980 UF-70]|uniref:Uncharacterized protein n=1 Tax=Sclerotinia sclerotiorum (strain ATCC 18683 / 1980 / Ss-1) TaxID=665079 RepID=A7EN18_SCLS1|nr:hypothetical protein SS1G_06717 [Sclerotinia sclerotiorum 1980 UF-70]EDO04234.1 hypothetical protein SS1G_06717 [Sclerotinia sclerotiorum 1980 UF-70]